MKPSNYTFPSEADTSSAPTELTMDAFLPVETPLQLHMDGRDAMEEERLPYACQDPCNAAHVTIVTPDGSYASDSIRIDEAMNEIVIDADGVRILLDRRNVVLYLGPETPVIYRNALCDVRFTT